jgi:uncharacterized protein YjbI with pentapeptide repeats
MPSDDTTRDQGGGVTAEQADVLRGKNSPRERLLIGEALRFDITQPEGERSIEAAWIAEAAQKRVKIDIQDAVILGPLNLKYATFDEEVSFVGCVFKDPVDFSNTTLHRNLNLSGTTFQQGALFVAATLECDMILNGARFLALGAEFVDLHVVGVLLARGASFENGVMANFNRAHFDKLVIFEHCRFEGDTDFVSVQFGNQTRFGDTVFKQKVNFSTARFVGSGVFGAQREQKLNGAIFEGYVNFAGAEIGSTVAFQGAVFKQGLSFNGAKIAGSAFFRGEPEQDASGAVFEGEVDFVKTEIGGDADFRGVQFNSKDKSVSFNGARIASSACFCGASFEGGVDFIKAEIGGSAEFQGVQFRSKDKAVSFNGTKIAGSAFFRAVPEQNVRGTVFEGEADFTGAEIGSSADFRGVQFKSKERLVSFNGAKIAGSAFFRGEPEQNVSGAMFEGQVDFGAVEIDSTAEFTGATFKWEVSFDAAEVGGSAGFEGVHFLEGSKPSFRGAHFLRDVSFLGGVFSRRS